MSENNWNIRSVCALGVIQLLVLLAGCDNDDYQRPDEVLLNAAITPSAQEGVNPFEVTFDVTGIDDNSVTVTWDFGDGEKTVTSGNSSATHTFTTPGEVLVNATIELSLTASRTIRVPLTVLPNINLVVSSFAIADTVIPNSGQTISAIIQNTGLDALKVENVDPAPKYINVGYYLSTDEEITVDDIYIGDTSIAFNDNNIFTPSEVPFGFEALAPGGNYQYNHQIAIKGNVPDGLYFAGAIVDYIDEFDWYDFPRATDTKEYAFPTHFVVPETDEEDNAKLLTVYQVSVAAAQCTDDLFENDDSSATATPITVGATQAHNFCYDNSDWLQFDAVQGGVYEITTSNLGSETDTQLILYDTDASSILLFHDNIGDSETVDLESDFPLNPESEIVWEAPASGTYFIKVRTTACDEDEDPYCSSSPDGVGANTEYSITLQ